jgi:hypothetical protein
LGTRLSLRPLSFEGQKFGQTSGASRRENAGAYPLGCLTIESEFAVLLSVKTVGVMGDGRTYEYAVGLHAVGGMTAD